jgi:hypothetical protein
MKFIAAARLIVALMPILVAAIKSAEELFPEGGNGATKLALVRGLIESAYATASDTEATFDEIWPTLKRAIDSIVAAFNSARVFRS